MYKFLRSFRYSRPETLVMQLWSRIRVYSLRRCPKFYIFYIPSQLLEFCCFWGWPPAEPCCPPVLPIATTHCFLYAVLSDLGNIASFRFDWSCYSSVPNILAVRTLSPSQSLWCSDLKDQLYTPSKAPPPRLPQVSIFSPSSFWKIIIKN